MLRNLKISLIFTVLHVAGSYAELCSSQMSTPNCQQLRQIELSMDATVNPCADFYGYSCNNWERSQNSTSTSHYNNPVEMLYYQMDLQMVSVMDSLDRQTLPLEILNDTYNYYQSCLNAQGSNVLIGYLEIIKPGKELEWPLLQELRVYQSGDSNYSADDWPAEHFDYYALLGQLRNYGLHDVIIRFQMKAYLSANVRTVIRPPNPSQLTQPVILNLLEELGFPRETALNYSQRLEKTRNYWEHLPLLSYAGNMTRCSELKRKFPYFQRFLENIDIYHYSDSYEIDVQSEEYYQLLLKEHLSHVQKREVCNYIMLRWLLYLKTNAAKDFSKIECIKETRTKLELPMNVLYYGYIYKTDEFYTNADIATLFTKTRDYMLQTFQKYLGNQSHHIEKIKNQLANFTLNMGNLPKSMSTLYFKNLFQGLPNLSTTNYYRNNLNLLKQQARFSLIRYQKTHFLGGPLDIHISADRPFYDGYSKTLILPFYHLQPPIYHHNLDAIFKWSKLGYLISNGLYYGLSSFDNLSRVSNVEVAFRAYANEQKSRLQPDFTNIPWKKLFFLNLAQIFCAPKGTNYRKDNLDFVRRLPLDLDIFREAFQCGSKGADNSKW